MENEPGFTTQALLLSESGVEFAFIGGRVGGLVGDDHSGICWSSFLGPSAQFEVLSAAVVAGCIATKLCSSIGTIVLWVLGILFIEIKRRMRCARSKGLLRTRSRCGPPRV